MRHVIAILMICLLCAAVAAAEQPRAQRAAGAEPVQSLPDAVRVPYSCPIGNQASPFYSYGNWIMGADAYAYLVQPLDEGCTCDQGFLVNRISMYMQFAEGDVPEDFSVYVGLADAVWDEGAGVFRPGEEYCTSATWALTAATAGLYDIYVDLDGACPCADSHYPYFITFHLPQPLVWWADALEDSTPDLGVSYYDGGSGWEDLVGVYGWWGNNILHAEASCCDNPVAGDEVNWGDVKAMFR